MKTRLTSRELLEHGHTPLGRYASKLETQLNHNTVMMTERYVEVDLFASKDDDCIIAGDIYPTDYADLLVYVTKSK